MFTDYLRLYLDFYPCSWSTIGNVQRLWSNLGSWRPLLWPLRVPGSHLGVGTSQWDAQHWAACPCSPWSFDLWPCCRSRTSVPFPCSHQSMYCSFSGHCTCLTCSWPAQTSTSAQSKTQWSSVVCLKWSKLDWYLFLWFLPFGCILSFSLSMIISWFFHPSLVQLYLHRYWVPLLPIQPLMRAALNSFSVLKLSSTTFPHLMSSCSKHDASQMRMGFPIVGILTANYCSQGKWIYNHLC